MKESNTYIFLYSSAMVILVAAILSAVSTFLKPYQDLNIELARKLDILRSVGQAREVGAVPDRRAYIEEEYERFIVESYVIDHNGEIQEDLVAAELNVRQEYRRPLDQRNLAIYVSRDDEGNEYYVIPVFGRGLWGPVFGYVALEDDFNTIFGVIFDHESETPGLGAEIAEPFFENQFSGKRIFDDDGEFVSIQVVKSGTLPLTDHRVDGVSGGTITGQGVEAMLRDALGSYVTYFRQRKNQDSDE